MTQCWKSSADDFERKSMSPSLSLDTTRAAVLSMDLQAAIVSIYTKGDSELVARAADVLKEAREHGLTVIHIQVGFRPGLPEISLRNPLLCAIKNSIQHQRLFQGTAGAIHPAVAPQHEDILITKHRISAFAGTDLEMILRARDIDTLILFGIATSGVVLSTLLHASDADYRLFLVKDCCIDLDEEVHACLINKVFPRLATVLDANDYIEALKAN
jgi:nicotinamidase-related amidase